MQENDKRIAKNTLLLYFRMLLTMAVSLYTSRVVLNTLGVDDFGIYGVVGGIIAMFGFLNTSMAGATSRFITFELGKKDYERLAKTFSAALTVHFIIAIIILLIGETAGLWWLEHKLVIAPDRMDAARWVFHLSVLASMINITQAPYNAAIIAHERMSVYAYVEILNSLLKLGIVYLLVVGNFDKLILYAVLTLCVTIIITTIYKIYCTRNFAESHYKFRWDKEIIKPMIAFSGWDLCGSFSYLSKTQGINILLNLFFGTIVNAAYGISTTIQAVINQFSSNFMTAVRPQITKLYANNEIEKMQRLMFNASKISFFLIFLLSLPLIIETKFILEIWLIRVPDYAIPFCRLLLLTLWISAMFIPVQYAVQATGKIKRMTLTISTVYILVLPISYFCFKSGFEPASAFVINLIITFCGCQVYIWALHKNIPRISLLSFYTKVMSVCLISGLLSSLVPFCIHFIMDEGWGRLTCVFAGEIITAFIVGYFFILSKDMQKQAFVLLKQKMKIKV